MSDDLQPLIVGSSVVLRRRLKIVSLIAIISVFAFVGCAIALVVVTNRAPSHDLATNDNPLLHIDGWQGFQSNSTDFNGTVTIFQIAPLATLIATIPTTTTSISTISENNRSVSSKDYACYAPPGAWGPVCTSGQGLISPYANQWIYYHIEATRATAVFCKVVAGACPSGGPCCWAWHPRTAAGIPIWNGPIGMIWGSNAASPQITCMGSPFGSVVRWSWTTNVGMIGCYEGYNCNIPGC